MPESLAPDRAYALASRLTLIPGFPNRDQAIQAIAEWLLETCTDLGQAQWLIAEAVCDRVPGSGWEGVSELQSRYDARYPRSRAGICGSCWGSGVVHHVVTSDSVPPRWCRCSAGVERRILQPHLLRQIQDGEVTLGDMQ